MAPKKKAAAKKTTKRKADTPPADAPEDKAPRTETTDDAAQSAHDAPSTSSVEPLKVLRWLLSDEATAMICDDEVGTADQRSYRTRPGELSPFEELVRPAPNVTVAGG